MTDRLGPFRAEWLKILRNYKVNLFLIWILPAGLLVFYTLMIVGGILAKAPPEELVFGCGGRWTGNLFNIWNFLIVSEGDIFGRMLPLAFFAVVFAGEYHWGTWKNLVPRSRRRTLLFQKAGAALLAVSASILISAPISAGGQALLCRVGGEAFGPSPASISLAGVLADFLLHSLIGILVLGMVLGFAALAAVLSRSILGGFLGGFGLSLLEILSLPLLTLLAKLFNSPGILRAYLVFPGYSTANLQAWFFQAPTPLPEALGTAAGLPGWASLLILTAWAVLPLLAAAAFFQLQDLAG